MKFEDNWPIGFRGEVVQRRGRSDGRPFSSGELKKEVHGLQRSLENCCKSIRSFTCHSLSVCQVSRQWLKQFLRYLAYKVKMLKLSKGDK